MSGVRGAGRGAAGARHRRVRRVLLGVVALLVSAVGISGVAAPVAGAAPNPPVDDLWQVIGLPAARPGTVAAADPLTDPAIDIHTTEQVALRLDDAGMAAALAAAPMEALGAARSEAGRTTIELPAPDGTMDRFAIVESPVMAPELAAKFPETTTYAGQGIDDPAATIRLDQGPSGFHAQVLSPNGTWYIDPYFHLDDSVYVSYLRSSLINTHGAFVEANADELQPSLGDPIVAATPAEALPNVSVPRSSGSTLRVYRLAVAGNVEYSTFHGGTKPLVLNAIVTAVNRVTGIYEVELTARFQLVANNDLLISLTEPDPYTNNNPDLLLIQNQSNVDSVIGGANYDVGHVFTTGGGGLAALGVIGLNGQKARGETGSSKPTTDAFWVDYVAHELGHQFGGNHTFNGALGNCGGNAKLSAAMEPGSGTTIQAYAGICLADDLQNRFPLASSDPYFHAKSYDEMQIVMARSGQGGTTSATGNSIPMVTPVGGPFTIPPRTPFALTATGTDADASDALTFNWEQYDPNSQRALADNSKLNGALFRSFTATASGERWFPSRTSVLANTTNAVTGSCPVLPGGLACFSEFLPTSARTMNFRVTVRDNKANGGGVNVAPAVVTVAGATPFLVTSQNSGGTFAGLSSQPVSWDVAGTSAGAVNTPNVDIFVSTDGGTTWPIVLAATANDGSESVTFPNVDTTQARVMVKGSGNIFFDVSNTNFTIIGIPVPPDAPTAVVGTPGDSQVLLSWTAPAFSGSSPLTDYMIEFRAVGAPAYTVFADAVSNATTATVTGLTNGAAYVFRVSAKNAIATGTPSADSSAVTPVTVPGAPGAPTGTAGNGRVALSWPDPAPNGGSAITDYVVEFKPSGAALFTTFADGVSIATTAMVTGLANNAPVVFRVSAVNAAGAGAPSAEATFTPVSAFVALSPLRIFDTRPRDPQGAVPVVKQKYGGGNVLRVKVTGAAGVPLSGVGAVSLNVVAVTPDGPGFVTVYPCGDRPLVASLNYVTGQIVPNAVIAPVSPSGEVCFFSLADTHIVADVNGWFPVGGGFNAVTPLRVFDTRADSPQGVVPVVQQKYGGPGNILRVKVTGAAGVPLAGVGAVSLNVTAAFPDGPGFITVFPCGDRPLAANLNYVTGQIVPNAVIAPVSPNGEVCFFSLADTHIIADVNGWFATGSGFEALTPLRVFDTRPDSPQGVVPVVQQKYGGPGNILRVKVTGAAGVPLAGVGAVSLNVTAAFPDGPGFITVFPCGDRPLAANLNYVTGQIVPNAVIAPVSSNGEVCFFSLADTHIIADVNGWFGT